MCRKGAVPEGSGDRMPGAFVDFYKGQCYIASYNEGRRNSRFWTDTSLHDPRRFVTLLIPAGARRGREKKTERYMIMKKTLVVTAVGSFSAPAVVKGLKELGYRVVGTELNPPEYIAESAETDRFVQVPRCDAGEAYLSALEAVVKEEEAEGIVPLTDAEIDVLNGCRERFLPAKLWISPEDVIRRARNKALSAEAARKAAEEMKAEAAPGEETVFSVIPTVRLTDWLKDRDEGGSAERDPAMAEVSRLPLVFKPDNGRSSEGLFRIYTPEDTMRALTEIFSVPGNEDRYLVQPLIKGNVVAVDCVRDEDGNSAALAREECLRTHNGAGLSVRVYRDAAVERFTARVAAELGVTGCVNFEFIRAGEREYRFLECNPRFAGGTGFSVTAGLDVVKLHADVFAGRTISPENPARNMSIARKYVEVVTKEC